MNMKSHYAGAYVTFFGTLFVIALFLLGFALNEAGKPYVLQQQATAIAEKQRFHFGSFAKDAKIHAGTVQSEAVFLKKGGSLEWNNLMEPAKCYGRLSLDFKYLTPKGQKYRKNGILTILVNNKKITDFIIYDSETKPGGTFVDTPLPLEKGRNTLKVINNSPEQPGEPNLLIIRVELDKSGERE
jgi:hypothetical protein